MKWGFEERSRKPSTPSARKRTTHLPTVFGVVWYSRAVAALVTLPSTTARTIASRPLDVRRAFLWVSIRSRASSESLLLGLIFDDRGNRMTPSHSRKQGLRYRYYVSSTLIQGQPELAGSVIRIPAAEIESLICNAVAQHANEPAADVRELVTNRVARVDITATSIEVTVNPTPKSSQDHKLNLALRDQDGEHDARDVGSVKTDDQHDNANQAVLSIPWTKKPAKRHREIMIPNGANRSGIRPIRAETRAKLVSAIARGRLWLSEIESGAVSSVEDIAAREKCSRRHVNLTISLAFLAPSLVNAAVDGRLPHGIGVARMFDLPPGWVRQYEILGLVPPA